jgi:hypothetical protein
VFFVFDEDDQGRGGFSHGMLADYLLLLSLRKLLVAEERRKKAAEAVPGDLHANT